MADEVDKWTMQYVWLRDQIAKIDEEWKKKKEELQNLQTHVGAKIQRFMNDHGVENLKTANGTCYLTTRYTASLADADAFMNFVISSKNFDLLERRANSTAVRAYVAEYNELPVGCNLTGLQQVGVRRPTGK